MQCSSYRLRFSESLYRMSSLRALGASKNRLLFSQGLQAQPKRNYVFRYGASVHPPLTPFHSTSVRFLGTTSEVPDDRVVVAILGPPNAGKSFPRKSTLFNRLLDKETNRAYQLAVDRKKARRRSYGRIGAGKKHVAGTAIVSDVPGTTRDRRECVGRIGGIYCTLIDTAGVDGERLEATSQQALVRHMMDQTLEAARQADVVFFMWDARLGLTSDLQETARWLRKTSTENREIVLIANKLEGDQWNYEGSAVLDHLQEASRLGFGEPIPISAQHAEGLADLAIELQQAQDRKTERRGSCGTTRLNESSEKEKPLQLAIVGRQNVGKSTLVNNLLSENRVLAGATPGLTRDAISIGWSWKNRPVNLVDTAGIRKRLVRQAERDDIEDMSVQDALRAMKIADVAVLVLDASARKLSKQELIIAKAVLDEGRALVVVANKMDLIVEQDYTKHDFTSDVREQLEARFPLLRRTPVVAMSSLLGDDVHKLMPTVFRARDRWARTVNTGQLNSWLHHINERNPPPMMNGRPSKIKYITQTKGRPPTFLLFCNQIKLSETYLRSLTKSFQDTFDMYGMAVRLSVKQSSVSNPFARQKTRSGSGLGGHAERKKRVIHSLKTTGKPKLKRSKRKKR